MRRWRVCVGWLLVVAAGFAATEDEASKMGARLRSLVFPSEEMKQVPPFLVKPYDGRSSSRLFISGKDAAGAVRRAGGFVNTDLGSWVTAEVPLDRLRQLA